MRCRKSKKRIMEAIKGKMVVRNYSWETSSVVARWNFGGNSCCSQAVLSQTVVARKRFGAERLLLGGFFKQATVFDCSLTTSTYDTVHPIKSTITCLINSKHVLVSPNKRNIANDVHMTETNGSLCIQLRINWRIRLSLPSVEASD